jgi:VanZ family protein
MTTKVRYLPAIVVMVAIFIGSHLSGDQIPPTKLLNYDKFWHALEYALLAVTVLFARRPPENNIGQHILIIAFCVAYGISDEIHQYFIPLRSADGWDVCADSLGALLAGSGWYLVNRRRQAL